MVYYVIKFREKIPGAGPGYRVILGIIVKYASTDFSRKKGRLTYVYSSGEIEILVDNSSLQAGCATIHTLVSGIYCMYFDSACYGTLYITAWKIAL